jgi:hypothetical protein
MNICKNHEWVELSEDIVYCRHCPAVGFETERDVSHGDYMRAERWVVECDDLPEYDKWIRAVAVWAVHALPTSSIERHIRDALHYSLGVIGEMEEDQKREYEDVMRNFNLGMRKVEVTRADQRAILDALQQQEMQSQHAYENAEDADEAQAQAELYDTTGALVLKFQRMLEFTDIDRDADAKQISYQETSHPTIDLPDVSQL